MYVNEARRDQAMANAYMQSSNRRRTDRDKIHTTTRASLPVTLIPLATVFFMWSLIAVVKMVVSVSGGIWNNIKGDFSDQTTIPKRSPSSPILGGPPETGSPLAKLTSRLWSQWIWITSLSR